MTTHVPSCSRAPPTHTSTPCSFLTLRPPPTSPLFPYTTLFRSVDPDELAVLRADDVHPRELQPLGRMEGEQIHPVRSEEHTSELQSPYDLVCRLLLEKKKK